LIQPCCVAVSVDAAAPSAFARAALYASASLRSSAASGASLQTSFSTVLSGAGSQANELGVLVGHDLEHHVVEIRQGGARVVHPAVEAAADASPCPGRGADGARDGRGP